MTHQNILLDGQDRGSSARLGSRFCNEGKWNNFISPLLPDECSEKIFIEYGSNAGLFLKLAKDKGFETVMGLERSGEDCRNAREYLKENNVDCRVIHTSISPKLDFGSLPAADITLLANFHYHQHINEFTYILDQLETRTCYCIVVSVNDGARIAQWRSQPFEEDVKFYFKNWDLIRVINNVPMDSDPHPRAMFSMLFKSRKIERVPIEKIKFRKENHFREFRIQSDFIKDCLNGKDIKDTEAYTRGPKSNDIDKDKFLEEKKQVVNKIAKNRLTEAVIVDRHSVLVDGFHRLVTYMILGYKTIISRKFI